MKIAFLFARTTEKPCALSHATYTSLGRRGRFRDQQAESGVAGGALVNKSVGHKGTLSEKIAFFLIFFLHAPGQVYGGERPPHT